MVLKFIVGVVCVVGDDVVNIGDVQVTMLFIVVGVAVY
jgi:hypothetical protein